MKTLSFLIDRSAQWLLSFNQGSERKESRTLLGEELRARSCSVRAVKNIDDLVYG